MSGRCIQGTCAAHPLSLSRHQAVRLTEIHPLWKFVLEFATQLVSFLRCEAAAMPGKLCLIFLPDRTWLLEAKVTAASFDPQVLLSHWCVCGPLLVHNFSEGQSCYICQAAMWPFSHSSTSHAFASFTVSLTGNVGAV